MMSTMNEAPKAEHVGMLVLRELAVADDSGRRVGLEDLARGLGVRRVELRAILSRLHEQGLVDVLRMRPTLAGFALGRAASGLALRELRQSRAIPAAPTSFRAA